MKIFIDTANIEEISIANDWGVIDGVTTNPSLIAKESKCFKELINEIVGVIDGPISVEATSIDSKGMIEEAIEFSSWSPNIVIKIPMTKEGLKAVKILDKKEIKTNVTLIFSVNQILLAAKAGATYVSPFVGRIDDTGSSGMEIVYDGIKIMRNYNFKTEIIVASIRHPIHVVEAAKSGSHVATIPFNVIDKMFNHPLSEDGLKKFLKDWELIKK